MDPESLAILPFSSVAGVCVVCIHVVSYVKTLLNFGRIDGSRSLNRSRVLNFEKFPDPDPDWKILEQERCLKMWLRPPLLGRAFKAAMHNPLAACGLVKGFVRPSRLFIMCTYNKMKTCLCFENLCWIRHFQCRSLARVYHLQSTGRLPRVLWNLGVKLISSFIIFTLVFLCTKVISNRPCCISTKLAYDIKVWEWMNTWQIPWKKSLICKHMKIWE